jgi:hypothetical protein
MVPAPTQRGNTAGKPGHSWFARPPGSQGWRNYFTCSSSAVTSSAGLSQFSLSYSNPAGGGIAVELDVPGGAIHFSITVPPQLRVWDPTVNRYQGESGYGSAMVGFQDEITVHGPSLAAYQCIPITLIAHLDGSMTAGTSADGTDWMWPA